jgi:hypothetical protein
MTSFCWADQIVGRDEERFFDLKERVVDDWGGVATTIEFGMSVEGVSVPVANAVRKAVMSMVHTTAIDTETVVIHCNTSGVHNEQITHRLSLIPLHVEAPRATSKISCKISLDATNEAREGMSERMVTSRDLIVEWTDPTPGGGNVTHAPQCAIVRPSPVSGKYMPLVALGPMQSIRLECGITTDCALRGGGAFQNQLCSYGVDGDSGMIRMRVEGYVSRDASELFVEAVESLRESCGALLDEARVVHHPDDQHMFTVDMENDVNVIVANMLQSFILQNRDGKLGDRGICFVGVNKMHPLQSSVRMVLAFRKDVDMLSCHDVLDTLAAYCVGLSAFLKDLVDEFKSFVARSRLARRKTQHTPRTR